MSSTKNTSLGKSAKGERKIIGHTCPFSPPELITAAGLTPYRIRGNVKEPIAHADAYFEPYGCPYVRNLFDQGLRGSFDFLDGLVMSHSCDAMQRIYGIWCFYHPPKSAFMVNVPNTTAPYSIEFYKRELQFFREWLEKLVGRQVTVDDLRKGIELHNANRALVRDLYGLMKEEPPRLSGSELFELLISGVQMPADEFNAALLKAKRKFQRRKATTAKRIPRLMIYGNIIDDPSFMKVIEDCGANVVVDDTCLGTKSNWKDVRLDIEPLDALANYYLVDFTCPRTYHGVGLERFHYLGSLASEFKVDGIILSTLSYCDLYGLDIPDVKRYLQGEGYPCFVMCNDYLISSVEGQRSGIEAFVELLRK